MALHTPGPWTQGRTLQTRTTRDWSREQWDQNERVERRAIFSNFHGGDEGKSRKLVARFENEEDAAIGAAAPDMLAALKDFVLPYTGITDRSLRACVERKAHASVSPHAAASVLSARAAIAKAEGRPQ